MSSSSNGIVKTENARTQRIIPTPEDMEDTMTVDPSQRHALAPPMGDFLNKVIPEKAFYRVLKESKLFSIDFVASPQAQAHVKEMKRTERSHHGHHSHQSSHAHAHTNAHPQSQSPTESKSFVLKKMPDEIVASRGKLCCLLPATASFSSSASALSRGNAKMRPTWFIQLAHVENAFMLYGTDTQCQPSDDQQDQDEAHSNLLLQRLADNQLPHEERGRFYFRVLVPIELRKSPDLLAPVISRTLIKNAEEIIEAELLYRLPQSHVTFVKLAYEDGWLFETLNSGIGVLERLESEPQVEHGHFFYLVQIPVGIRVAPHIMAQRAGKGFKLNCMVEGSQRFTPPGSKITYVKVCHEKGWIFETTMDGQTVLKRIEKPPQRQVERLFFRLLQDVQVLDSPVFTSEEILTLPVDPPATQQQEEQSQQSQELQATQQEPSSLIDKQQNDGEGVNSQAATTTSTDSLEPQASPVRSVPQQQIIKEEQATKQADQVDSSVKKPSRSCPRKRLKDSVIECSERVVPFGSDIGYLKLRHDAGWICERDPVTKRLVVEQVQGYAVTRDTPKFYRVLIPVAVRSAPDFDSVRLPGVPPKSVGTIFESSLRYTPPGSKITYVKLANESGWVFEQTPQGDHVLEALCEDPEKNYGKFFYRVLHKKIPVLLSPEESSEIVRFMFRDEIFAGELEYSLPTSELRYVRLAREKGWVRLDVLPTTSTSSTIMSSPPASGASIRSETELSVANSIASNSSNLSPNTLINPNTNDSNKNANPALQRVSEEMYNLYTMPPSWVSIGFPNRTWCKVPDEECRTVLVEETFLQASVFKSRHVLAASSQGRDNVPVSRKGIVALQPEGVLLSVTLEEIKHSASALMFTFPWKQVWWIFEIGNVRHSVELQHGLRGGYRAVYLDGVLLHQTRSISDIFWDSGSEYEFSLQNHKLKTIISLEGAFFSQYLQFYSYTLLVDEEQIVPLPL